MGQPVIAVHNAVNSAFKDFVTAPKLLFSRHIVARFYQTKFSRFTDHVLGPKYNKQKIGCCAGKFKLC